MQMSESAVKRKALELGLPILQPTSLRDETVRSQLERLRADLFVVVAYGLLLPKAVLGLPPKGCINVHFSLLPKLRGAAPVQWAIIEGHAITGVSVMQMDEGMDTGPVFDQAEEPILPEDDAASLGARLASKGASELLRVLDAIEKGQAIASPQVDEQATWAPKITSELARIDWQDRATSLVRRIHGLSPKPGAWTTLDGRRLKVWRAAEVEDPSVSTPGTLDVASKEMLVVDTGSNRMSLLEVQPEGKSKMSAAEFIRGYRPQTGVRLI